MASGNKSQISAMFGSIKKDSNLSASAVAVVPAKVAGRDEDEEDVVTVKKIELRDDSSKEFNRTKDYSIFLPYPNEKLRLALHEGEARKALKESIEKYGITTPLKVAPIQGGKFIILGGHNRLDIAKELGIEVPYMVFNNLTEEQKDDIVAEEHILNRQQSDLKPSQMMTLLLAIQKASNNSKELIEKASLGKASIYNYLALNNLLTDLLAYVDEGKISIHSAVSLSKLKKDTQQLFLDYIKTRNKGIAEKPMKELLAYDESLWNLNLLKSIFEDKPAKAKVIKIDFPEDKLNKYLTDEELKHPQEVIELALKEYHERNHK